MHTDPRSVVCYFVTNTHQWDHLASSGTAEGLFYLSFRGWRVLGPNRRRDRELLTKICDIRHKSSMQGNQTNLGYGCEVHTLEENSCLCSKLMTILFKGLCVGMRHVGLGNQAAQWSALFLQHFYFFGLFFILHVYFIYYTGLTTQFMKIALP